MSDRPNNEAPEKLPIVRPERKHALLLVLIAVVGLLAASLLVGLILPRSASRLHQLLAMDVFYYLPFMVLPVALVMRKRGSLGALRPNPIAPGDVFLIIPLALLGVLAVNYIITLWAIPLQKLGLDVYAAESIPAAQSTRDLVLSVLAAAVFPGVCEELLFRGAVLPAFERGGTKRAVFIAAALFTILHGSLAGLPSQFLLGVIMGTVVVLTDSIYAGLIYHTVHNAALLIWQFLLDTRVRGVEPAPDDILTSLGGANGVAVLLFGIAQLGIWMGLILMVMRRRARSRGLEIQPPQKQKLRGSERALLAVIVMVALLLYLVEILAMAGGIQ